MQGDTRNTDHVLLIHGLAETSLWMKAIEFALRRERYIVHSLDYPSTKADIATLTEDYFAPAVEKLESVARLHIVTHSMGGVMVRNYLKDREIHNLGRVVMMAPGHSGSRLLSYLRHNPLFPILMGPAGVESADDDNCFACGLPEKSSSEIGIIAGCVALDPLSWFTVPWPHDGKLRVDATKLETMKDHIVVAASHDTMVFDPIAIGQASHFLRHGNFARFA